MSLDQIKSQFQNYNFDNLEERAKLREYIRSFYLTCIAFTEAISKYLPDVEDKFLKPHEKERKATVKKLLDLFDDSALDPDYHEFICKLYKPHLGPTKSVKKQASYIQAGKHNYGIVFIPAPISQHSPDKLETILKKPLLNPVIRTSGHPYWEFQRKLSKGIFEGKEDGMKFGVNNVLLNENSLELECYATSYSLIQETCNYLEIEYQWAWSFYKDLEEFKSSPLDFLPSRKKLHELAEKEGFNPLFEGKHRIPGLSIATLFCFDTENGMRIQLAKRRGRSTGERRGSSHVIPAAQMEVDIDSEWNPADDYSIRENFLREYAEELFNQKKLTAGNRWYKRSPLRGEENEIIQDSSTGKQISPVEDFEYLMKQNNAHLSTFGINIDLFTLRPEICLLVMVDKIWTEKWRPHSKVNDEFDEKEPLRSIDIEHIPRIMKGDFKAHKGQNSPLEFPVTPQEMCTSGAACFFAGLPYAKDLAERWDKRAAPTTVPSFNIIALTYSDEENKNGRPVIKSFQDSDIDNIFPDLNKFRVVVDETKNEILAKAKRGKKLKIVKLSQSQQRVFLFSILQGFLKYHKSGNRIITVESVCHAIWDENSNEPAPDKNSQKYKGPEKMTMYKSDYSNWLKKRKEYLKGIKSELNKNLNDFINSIIETTSLGYELKKNLEPFCWLRREEEESTLLK